MSLPSIYSFLGSLSLLWGFPGLLSAQSNSPSAREVSFQAEGINIYADWYESAKTSPCILLFHQAGSNARGEYGLIIPKLLAQGYNVLAVDLVRGGTRFGSSNRTLERMSQSPDQFTFCDVYPNLEAALDYLIEKGFSGNKILWGSSYSAALVVQLAAKRSEDVAGVLAFSPALGGPMQACKAGPYFEQLSMPFLLMRPPHEMEIESVKKQYAWAQKHGHQTFTAPSGVHGSSMLVPERVEGSVEAAWGRVGQFLEGLK